MTAAEMTLNGLLPFELHASRLQRNTHKHIKYFVFNMVILPRLRRRKKLGFTKWRHSNRKRMFNAVTGWQNSNFLFSVRSKFREKNGPNVPNGHTAVHWHQHLLEHGNFERHRACSRLRATSEMSKLFWNIFAEVKKSTVRASHELKISRSNIHDVAHKHIKLIHYTLQLVWYYRKIVTPLQFAVDILSRMDEDSGYLNKACCSEQVTFHISVKFSCHNCRICWSLGAWKWSLWI
jgi:hypothetical protein